MLRELLKNKKAQNTAEYALLIALVIAGVVAMQTYAQRSLQARMRDAAHYMTAQNVNGDNMTRGMDQYEPNYVNKDTTVTTEKESVKRQAEGTTAATSSTNTSTQGNEETTYNTDAGGGL